ncbi:FlgB family protein [Salipiger mucosus]|uniref:Flagellar basal-body rod protein FlgB n=1 Tax=Salipiger mucosus DSM 16094 TaxID=1123237 RepID=S9RX89_9RHOB|nr:FlgB family protein [Salipiger mucosus]EPX82615.1 Flagellar basal-body rod protein FlgB [Salipiger mucosus DSM 16094]
MFENLDVFRTAMAMSRHAGTQQAVSAQNIANADTPGYRALEIPDFAETFAAMQGAARATRPGHLFGQVDGTQAPTISKRRETADPNGNTVSLEQEMMTAVNARRAHDRALAIYRSSLTLLRTSLGR